MTFAALDTHDALSRVQPGIVKGREPLEGYKRGFGLQFGGLAETVGAEGLFRFADEAPTIRPLAAQIKRKNLYLLITRYLPLLASQDVIEFGAYQGGNAIFMALVLREVAPHARVFALDTYEGMPETDHARDAHFAGQFADAALDHLQEERARLGLTNLVIVKGLFQETFPTLQHRYGLAHIDCDIYSAVKYVQRAVWPRMTPGGYIVYDDAEVSSCLGATEAVEELIQSGLHSEQIWPHFVFRAGL